MYLHDNRHNCSLEFLCLTIVLFDVGREKFRAVETQPQERTSKSINNIATHCLKSHVKYMYVYVCDYQTY